MRRSFAKATFLSAHQTYSRSPLIILGCPYDGTSSFRPGSRFAPNSIRKASRALETYSPSLEADLQSLNICDLGDLEFSYEEKTKILESIQKVARKLLADNKKFIFLGGEHLITFPLIQEIHRIYPSLAVIQFDAHADLREEYLGEKYSHATVMRRVLDIVGMGNLYQFGIRSGTREEFQLMEKIKKPSLCDMGGVVEELGDRPVYITVDLDILDPCVFPGTGTPEPGGWSFQELVSHLEKLKDLNLVGCDLVELSPDYDSSGISSLVGAKIVRELLLMLSNSVTRYTL